MNQIEPYRLELAAGKVDRTTWWKDCNTTEPANIWWITGPGLSRPATDIEIDLWRQKCAAEVLCEVFHTKPKRRK